MFIRLLFLLTVGPLVELTILMRMAERFTWRWTLGLVLFTGILGAWLARREGLKAATRIRSDLANGVQPMGSVVDGALILVAGVVLVTPGVLTDLCGFALLIPPFRRFERLVREAGLSITRRETHGFSGSNVRKATRILLPLPILGECFVSYYVFELTKH